MDEEGEVVDGLVSVIVPTKNSAAFLPIVLDSLNKQTYRTIEIVVSDNGSTDETVEIARRYGARVIQSSGERSKQLNDAATASRGEYLYRVDSDFLVSSTVIEECVNLCLGGADAVAVHNDSSPERGFWARVRQLERSLYKGDSLIVGARFLTRRAFAAIEGFDETLVAGEDYDLHNRLLHAGFNIARASSGEVHLGEPKTLGEIWRKHFYYGTTILRYVVRHPGRAAAQAFPIRGAFVRHWKALFARPILACGIIVVFVVKYAACACGALLSVFLPSTDGTR